MTEDTRKKLQQWLDGNIDLPFGQAESLRRGVLEAGGRGKHIPPSSWWKKAQAGQNGFLYRIAGEKLAEGWVLLTELGSPDDMNAIRQRLKRSNVEERRIQWGKQYRLYVRQVDAALLQPSELVQELPLLLPNGKPVTVRQNGLTLVSQIRGGDHEYLIDGILKEMNVKCNTDDTVSVDIIEGDRDSALLRIAVAVMLIMFKSAEEKEKEKGKKEEVS